MNAIILAAGMGTRLRPLTNNRPKCMVSVNGEPMIERQIRFLKETGIDRITLVSGYKSDKLEYLRDYEGIDIVFNEKYDICNNIYSMYKVLDRFGDTYVLEGDVYMHSNCIIGGLTESTYFAVKKSYENEWGLLTGPDMKLKSVEIGAGNGFIMSGVSYWNSTDAKIISNEIKRLINPTDFSNLFWDNAVLNVLSNLSVSVIQTNDLHEIDTEKELAELESLLKINS